MEKKVKRFPTDGLVNEICSENLLFSDQYGEAWIAIGKSGAELYQISSKGFKDWLQAYTHHNYNVILKNNQPKDIVNALSGIAKYDSSGEIPLEPRLHKTDEAVWYDLGREAVKITDKGWEIVENPPILFRRYSHQKKQVVPVRGGDIQEFHKFVNIKDMGDWRMFLTFATAAFLPDIAKPLLVLNGSQGAGKSTPMKMLKELIDPSNLTSCGLVKNEAELARLANTHVLMFFDNLSKLSWDMSDDICRLITGDGFSKRKLYTDNDEIVYSFKRALMMNGIANFVSRADLLDRSVIIDIERITEEQRKPENELWSEFSQKKPEFLGALLTLVSQGLANLPSVKPEKLPRMADFALWGYAIDGCLPEQYNENKYDFTKPAKVKVDFGSKLEENEKRRREESLESDPVAQAAIYLLRSLHFCDDWLGTVSAFYYKFVSKESPFFHDAPDYIRNISTHPMWPKNPSAMGRALRKSEGLLKEHSIHIGFSVQDGERMVKLAYYDFDKKRLSEYAEDNDNIDTEVKQIEENERFQNAEPTNAYNTLFRVKELKRKDALRLILDQKKRGVKYFGDYNNVATQEALARISLIDEKGNEKTDEVLSAEIDKILTAPPFYALGTDFHEDHENDEC